MNIRTITPILSSAILASGMFLSSVAFAKDGITTSTERDSIRVGMTQQEVESKIGKPLNLHPHAKTAKNPAVTWEYGAADVQGKDPKFHVDFGTDGKVTSTQIFKPGTD